MQIEEKENDIVMVNLLQLHDIVSIVEQFVLSIKLFAQLSI